MSLMKQSVTLRAPNNLENRYKVIALTNRLTPEVGSYLTQREAEALLNEARQHHNVTILVKP